VEWRNLVCGVMMAMVPAAAMAQDSRRAMLHSEGGTSLNGNPAPNSSAIFPHDLIQTQKSNTAKIDADGSTVTVQPDTLVQFEGDELVLDHGSLQVKTAHVMRVRVNCLTVIPITPDWTQYDVTDVDGKVTVAAYQNDVKIHSHGARVRQSKQSATSPESPSSGNSDAIVHQSEQKTRDEHCGAAAKPSEAIDAKGAILNSVWARGAGVVAIGVLTCWALCRGDEPVSPSVP
jgi:hypothetical protein